MLQPKRIWFPTTSKPFLDDQGQPFFTSARLFLIFAQVYLFEILLPLNTLNASRQHIEPIEVYQGSDDKS
jgi:hypothetical protein